jgi:molybdopterin-guanine dinucleotide biosynthesis protein B
MPFIISIVGRSNVGKTTLLEHLIAELKRRGYYFAIAKHNPHGFELDQPRKDSWRFVEAGSDGVVLSSPQRLAFIKRTEHDTTLEELSHFLGGYFALILTEGYKASNAPKIEVHRKGLGELLFPAGELLAIVTDEPLDVATPQYSPNDIAALADLIEKRFLALHEADDVLLQINGTPISIDPSVKDIVSKTLLGMVSVLGDAETIESLQISLRRGQGDFRRH